MEQVISDRYPSYGRIFVLHFLFAALGQYGCAVGARATASFCLLGMLISLLYTLEMSISVAFSKKRREKIVNLYVEKVRTGADEKEEMRFRLIFQMGQYVAERFLEYSLDTSDCINKKDEDNESAEKHKSGARFLTLVGRMNQIANDTEDKIKKSVQPLCRDMVAVFLCLTFLEQANSNRPILSADFRKAVVDELSQYKGSDYGIYWGDQTVRKYVSYACIIYNELAITALHAPSRFDMVRIIPVITETAKSWLTYVETF